MTKIIHEKKKKTFANRFLLGFCQQIDYPIRFKHREYVININLYELKNLDHTNRFYDN